MLKLISVIDGWSISCEIALRWLSLELTDDKSTLVQVMAWCRQATSHYLSQCWLRYMSPYGVTRPQWVNSSPARQNGTISLTISSDAFSWMKSFVFLSKFHWGLFPGLPTSKICFPYFVEKISIFLITFPYPLICSSSDSKQSLWQLLIYSGGTHWLPVETLVDSFGTTGTGSEEEHVLLPHVEERRMNVLVIKEAFEGFKA